MAKVKLFGEWFPEEDFLQALDALQKINPVLAFHFEGEAMYEIEDES